MENPSLFFRNRPLLHSGILTVVAVDNIKISSLFNLYDDCLVCVGDSPGTTTLATSIRWKRLAPFVEERKSGAKYFGFKIVSNHKSEDFYVANEDSLEEWLNLVSKRVICTDIEEDYEELDYLGDGGFATVHKAL
jgi:hypothetical protein